MKYFLALLTIISIGIATAQAEDDPMEFQRCIWRCLANANGADDPAYQACITRQCDGADAADTAPASTRDGRWVYGHHPVLGLSAHVNQGGEALGFACSAGDGGYSLSYRMTPGMVPEPTRPNATGVVSVFLDPFRIGGGATLTASDGGYVEWKSGYCQSSLPEYQRSRSVLFIDTDYFSLTIEDDGRPVMRVNQDGRRIRIASEADLQQVSARVSVPLAGSSAAIRKMINACPTLKREMAEGCDH